MYNGKTAINRMKLEHNKLTKRVIKWSVQALIITAIFIAISAFLARNMLSTQQQVPSFINQTNVKLISGNQLSLANLKDWSESPQHLIYFFAPWCTICAFSQPSLEAFGIAKPNVQIMMVALDWENEEQVTNFKAKHQFDFPVLLGNQTLKQQWQVDAYPSYYFVNAQGRVTSKDRGLVTLPGLIARSMY